MEQANCLLGYSSVSELEKGISTAKDQNVCRVSTTHHSNATSIIRSKSPKDPPQQLPDQVRRSLVHVVPRPRRLDHKLSLRLLRHGAALAFFALLEIHR